MRRRTGMRKKWLSAFCAAVLLAGVSGSAAAAPEEHCGTCYEVFVYSFYDSDGDGIGDLNGLTEKLDYINDGDPESETDLGCDMIWTMPVFASPTYHKYDVTDYKSIDPQYGTMEDFDAFLAACHERGIRVILDLPLNHTSSEHPWFRKAADYLSSLPEGAEPSVKDCRYAAYYNFSREAQNGYAALSDSGWYYEARFWEGMPDLNLDSPQVRSQITSIAEFWLDKGVDGFRLDAVTSFYTDQQQASIDFLSWFNDVVKRHKPEAYLVGEAWANQQTYAEYYASGIDSLFDFDFAGQEGLIAKVVRGNQGADKFALRLQEAQKLYASKGEQAVDAPFYTNHDMARSAGYYTKQGEARVKLAEGLNLFMPGNAFVYYGEELGMKGSGIDENKRAPMYWSTDSEAAGMCAGPPAMEEVKMKYGSLEEQESDPNSIYSYVRKAIHLRMNHPALRYGTVTADEALSGKEVCVLRYEAPEETLTMVINTSNDEQVIETAGTELGECVLAEMLCASEEEVQCLDGKIVLPPFSAALLEKP